MSCKGYRLLLPICLMILLISCGSKPAPTPTPDPEPAISVIKPTPDPKPDPLPYVNPLTGEGVATDIENNRPVAIMLNNLKKALPQLGVSQADIIYECPAEGGITRMMGVYQSPDDVGTIGSVRSARDYYVSLAAGLDAIYMHAGGSDTGYIAIKKLGVTGLDCVHGPYEGTLYWRDKDRKKTAGYEHSVVTSGDMIAELFPTYSRLRTEHNEDYTPPFTFTEENKKPTDGTEVNEMSVRFSSYKTGVFTYDKETNLYNVSQHGAPYLDGNNDEQVAVRNVIVLRTDINPIAGDTAGRLSVRLDGMGDGILLCDGVAVELRWERDSLKGIFHFTTVDGVPLDMGIGKTYVNIIDDSYEVNLT